MSDVNKKNRPVYYRLCQADFKDGHTPPSAFKLQDVLLQASKAKERPWMRVIDIAGNRTHLLAHLVHKQSCLCGTLVLSEKNKSIPLIDVEPNGNTWEGVTLPKDKEGILRRLQEQALYFAIRENHVAISQSKELDIGDLVDFLAWFIQGEAKLHVGALFTLTNLPSKSALEKLKDRRIKGISIGRNAFSIVKEPICSDEPKSTSKRKRYETHIETDSLAMDLLKRLLGDNSILDDIAKSGNPGKIRVELQISYRSRKETDAQEVMRAIAAIAGGNQDLNPEIQLEGDTKISGAEMTIKGTISVQAPSGIISADDAMARLSDWLNDAIITGRVIQ
jgi:hypothetical protein